MTLITKASVIFTLKQILFNKCLAILVGKHINCKKALRSKTNTKSYFMLQRQDVNYPRYEGMEEFSALFCLSIQASWHSWCFLAALLQLINYDKTRAEGKRSSRFEMTFSILTGRKGDRIWQWCRQSLVASRYKHSPQ